MSQIPAISINGVTLLIFCPLGSMTKKAKGSAMIMLQNKNK